MRSAEPRTAAIGVPYPRGNRRGHRPRRRASAHERLVARVGGRPDHLAAGQAGLDVLLPARRRRPKERGDGLAAGGAHGPVAGGGHDRRRREELTGVVDRQCLGDHPAQRDTDHVRTVDAQMGQEGGRVVGHVLDAIGRHRHLAAEEGNHERPQAGRVGELGREPTVTVVETDDEETLTEDVHEALGPGDQLCAQSHDEQQRGLVGSPSVTYSMSIPLTCAVGTASLPSRRGQLCLSGQAWAERFGQCDDAGSAALGALPRASARRGPGPGRPTHEHHRGHADDEDREGGHRKVQGVMVSRTMAMEMAAPAYELTVSVWCGPTLPHRGEAGHEVGGDGGGMARARSW